MKHLLLAMTAVMFLSTAAIAADAPAAAPAAADKAAAKTAKFETHKKAILDKISTHLADLQKRQECVSAAADATALKACKPVKTHHKCGEE